jgi:uncharacterized protein YegJ (DUF2314 family)
LVLWSFVLLKLIMHVAVAAALWFGLGAGEIGIPWRFGAIVVGAVLVHLLWEWWLHPPYYNPGAMPIHLDDPLLKEAVAEGRATLPRFLESIYPTHAKDTCVRFPFTSDFGTVEHLWADLLEVNGDRAMVFVRTFPIEHQGDFEPRMEISVAQISDWQVEYRDGTLRGGFTNRATFKIVERAHGYLPRDMKEQLARFRDLDEPERPH